jgi:hypothetical protein
MSAAAAATDDTKGTSPAANQDFKLYIDFILLEWASETILTLGILRQSDTKSLSEA